MFNINNRKIQLIHLTILAAAVLVVFGNSLLNGFVWDDRELLVGRSVYSAFDAARIFLTPANDVEYLPLRDLSYAVDYALWGERPAGFHLTNLLLYIGNIAAVYFLTRRLIRPFLPEAKQDLSRADAASFFCALLFAVHPLHSEAVSFITCRNVLLSGLFFFLSLNLFLRSLEQERLHPGCYAGAFISFAAALLSKATVIILPLLLVFLALFAPSRERRRRLLAALPFFPLSVGFYLLFRKIAIWSSIIDNSPQGFTDSPFIDRAATAVQIPWFYLLKFFLPLGLSANYDVGFSTSLGNPTVRAAFAGGLLIAAAILLWRRQPLLSFVTGVFLITLLPVLNIFATTPVVADRYAYLPLYPLCLLVGTYCAARGSAVWRRTAWSVTVLLVLFWSTEAVSRNAVWRTDRTLWENTLKISPNLMKNKVNLATVYFEEKEFERVFPLLEETRRTNFYNDYYHLLRGRLEEERGNTAVAVAAYLQAIAKNDDFIDACHALGHACEKIGQYDKAVEWYGKTLLSSELDTRQYRASARGALRRIQHLTAPEIDDMRRQVQSHPGELITRMLLAEKLARFGLYDEALQNFLELEKRGMAGWKLFNSIAGTYVKLKKFSEAAEYYEKSILLKPDDADTLNNLGITYKKLGEYRKSIPFFVRAASVDQAYPFAGFNLAFTYYQLGDRAESIRHFTDARNRFPELSGKIAPYLEELQSKI